METKAYLTNYLPLKMYKILIIDDEIQTLQVIFEILRKAGKDYKIQRATSASGALEILKHSKPDIIITDWEMPKLNGIEFIRIIKKDTKLRLIPVIMCTGIMTNSENLKTALEAGASDFIRKPIDEIELLARVQSMIIMVESTKEIQRKQEIILKRENELILLQLEEKNRELVTHALLEARNNKKVEVVVAELKKLFLNAHNKLEEKSIRKIIDYLETNLLEDSWAEFLKYYEPIYPKFIQELSGICTELTQNDIKICAYLRLNMMSKDIAEILGVSSKSIDVSRYRIRKKLKLAHEENLYKFLSNL